MAAKSGGKSKKSSGRGGARPGAGRKPKPVEDMREALKAALIPEQPAPTPPEFMCDAAEAALSVLRQILDNPLVAPKDRISAARELLNRTIGRPREAEPTVDDQADLEQVHIYMPDNGRESAAG